MLKSRLGLVAVASRFESGGERADAILPILTAILEKNGVKIIAASKVVWNMADAVEAAEKMTRSNLDALLLIHLSWVQDSIQYLFQNTVKKPIILWALPFAETFSVACIQHFGSILKSRGICYEYAYGLPDDDSQISKTADFALASAAARKLRDSRIGMIGPRQTWRIAGMQDMTAEEWDITKKFGFRIVHIEMEELRNFATSIGENDALALLRENRKKFPSFLEEADKGRLLYGAKIYLAAKKLFSVYGLSAAGVQCYPMYGGIANLASSWLSEEGMVLDTEGDVGHTMLLLAMSWIGDSLPAALGETGKVDGLNDCIHFVHEGSAAMSLAASGGVVAPAADQGLAVGFALSVMSEITVASLFGDSGRYRMLLAQAASTPVDKQEWLLAGRKFHGCLRFPTNAQDIFAAMMEKGVDHHLVIKQGNCLPVLRQFCRIEGIEEISLLDCEAHRHTGRE